MKNDSAQLYRHFDADNKLLYVGISLNTFARLSQHKDHSKWFEKIKRVEVEHFNTREEAMAQERKAIKTEMPMFNIAMKKTLREIEKEQELHKKEWYEKNQLILAEQQKSLIRHIQYNLAYKLEQVRDILSMTKVELDMHIEKGNLCTFEVLGRSNSRHPVKMKTMVSGWSLIDFVGFLEQKGRYGTQS
jgi:predicted GIY-YIG superfamily endonuclease